MDNKVYIGNDVFGRGTFGGGGFQIHIAANKIIEYMGDGDMSPLSIAMFAPGWTY